MGARAIQRLRIKIIAIMLAAFFVVMLLIALLVNGAYIGLAQARMGSLLDAIVQNDGVLPDEKANDSLPSTHRNVRYFLVTLDDDGQVVGFDGSNDSVVTREQAEQLTREVSSSFVRLGSVGNYYYKQVGLPDGRMVLAFVDGSVELGEGREVLSLTLLFLGGGLLIAFVLVLFLSRRAIHPEIEAARRQSEFVTNASHELKTPLAVIRANTELMETLQGSSEWTSSTLRQVDYLDGLVKNLVEIARADERDDEPVQEQDVSAVVADVVRPFEAVARSRGVALEQHLQPGVVALADEGRLRQLVRLLVDNAAKYCDEGGRIDVAVVGIRRAAISGLRRRGARIVVSNSYAAGAGKDYARLFERFYRADEAHSNQSGYGIGLSIAQRICEQYEGSIRASWRDGIISFNCILF